MTLGVPYCELDISHHCLLDISGNCLLDLSHGPQEIQRTTLGLVVKVTKDPPLVRTRPLLLLLAAWGTLCWQALLTHFVIAYSLKCLSVFSKTDCKLYIVYCKYNTIRYCTIMLYFQTDIITLLK